VRALANVASVTPQGYDTIYRNLASRVKVVAETCSALQLEVVHARHRKEGSTVLAVHDPACRTQKLLSKRNHKCTFLYNLHPLDETKCQYGWCLSFTPHCLRELDGATALDVFMRDLKVCAAAAPARASNSIVSILLKGGAEEPWLFSPVWKSKFYGASTPSTRRLLDGVAVPVPHRSTDPARPRHRREMTS